MKLKACLCLSVFLCCLLLTFSSLGQSSPRWLHNSFPGPGHAAKKGPWKPGQGSDRLEWISGFVVSPKDPKFMAMITDLGRMAITTDGEEFKPVNVISSFGCAIAFDPHRPKTIYALLDGRQSKQYPNGWWRSHDQGKTWTFLVEDEIQRIQRDTFLHDHARNRAKTIYKGNSQGLFISRNDGKTWTHAALKGQPIHHLASSENGESLYIIIGPKDLPKTGGDLYLMRRGNLRSLKLVKKEVRDIALTSKDGSTGILLDKNGIFEFTQHANKVGKKLYAFFHGKQIMVNPANYQHMIAMRRSLLNQHAFHFSKDGGKTWQHWKIQGDWNTSIKDYSPINHLSPNYWVNAKTNAFLGGRRLTNFLPGDKKAVVTWATNMVKSPLRSDDYGQNFKPFAHGGLFKSFTQIALGNDDRVIAVAAGEYGVVITRDGGKTWRGYYNGNTPLMMNIFEKGTGDFGFRRAGWGVAFDPRNDQRLIHTYGNKPSHILLSEDSGKSWKSVGTYEPKNENMWGQVLWHQQKPHIIYIHDQRSDDGGKTWKKLPMAATAMSASNGDVVAYKETARLFYVSKDRGETWTRIKAAPQSDDITTTIYPGRGVQAVFDPRPEFDPTQAKGSWRILTGGQDGCWIYEAPADQPGQGTWTLHKKGIRPQDDPETPRIWFGPMVMGKEGKQWVAYMGTRPEWGRARGGLTRRQFYRSEDGGKTWKQWTGPKVPGLPDRFYSYAMNMSPRSGRVYMGEYSGLYVYGHWKADQHVIHDSGE